MSSVFDVVGVEEVLIELKCDNRDDVDVDSVEADTETEFIADAVVLVSGAMVGDAAAAAAAVVVVVVGEEEEERFAFDVVADDNDEARRIDSGSALKVVFEAPANHL